MKRVSLLVAVVFAIGITSCREVNKEVEAAQAEAMEQIEAVENEASELEESLKELDSL